MSLSNWLAEKHFFRDIQALKSALVLVFSVYFIFMDFTVEAAEKISFQKKRGDFEDKIPDIAERYIGMSYGDGTRSAKDRLKSRFNVSVAEVDNSDKWQRTSLGIAVVSNESKHIESILGNVMNLVYGDKRVEVIDSTISYV